MDIDLVLCVSVCTPLPLLGIGPSVYLCAAPPDFLIFCVIHVV
jgi:hypothetical protein